MAAIFQFDFLCHAPNVASEGPREWAYVGDAVASLYVRTRLSAAGLRKDLSGAAVKHVSARGQAYAAEELCTQFTEEEMQIYRRGCNAKIGVVPRHTDPRAYSHATGWEGLLGWLYLHKCYDRLEALLARAYTLVEERKEPWER